MPSRRILLVAQIAPPSPLSAARRVGGLARHLAALGHEVSVLTSMLSGRGAIDGAARVVRTRDVLVSGINWRRQSFAALEGSAGGEYAPPSPVATLLVPDPAVVSWLPFALPRALRLARDADCVITTAPARSAHLIGLALSRRGTPWVADFRDGWRFEDQRAAWAHPSLDRFDAVLERAVVRDADVCIGVTRPITEDLRERLGATAETITNGYDRADPDLAAGVAPPVEANGRHTVVHTGSLAYGGRDAGPIVEALRVLRREDPGSAGSVQLVFAGPVSSSERAVLGASDVSDQIRVLGPLPRPEALALQKAADTLLLITGDTQVSIATGKLYEYFAAARPILVLGERSEAARLVRETDAGMATAASDPRAIARTLRALLRSPDAGAAPAALERFSYARIADAMADAGERAI